MSYIAWLKNIIFNTIFLIIKLIFNDTFLALQFKYFILAVLHMLSLYNNVKIINNLKISEAEKGS